MNERGILYGGNMSSGWSLPYAWVVFQACVDDAQTGLMCPPPALCPPPGQQSMHTQSSLKIKFNHAPLLVLFYIMASRGRAKWRWCIRASDTHILAHWRVSGLWKFVNCSLSVILRSIHLVKVDVRLHWLASHDHSGHNFAIQSQSPAFSVVQWFQLALWCSQHSVLNQERSQLLSWAIVHFYETIIAACRL